MEIVLWVIALYRKNILLVLAVACLAIAALFLIWPNLLIRINELLKRPIYSIKFETILDRVLDIDANIMGMRKTLGLVSLLTGLILVFIANQI